MASKTRKVKWVYASCPSCGSNLSVGTTPRMGQRFSCTACGGVSEVVWLNPVELDWPLDEDDGHDAYDDYEDEY